jgi:hypothetical protein
VADGFNFQQLAAGRMRLNGSTHVLNKFGANVTWHNGGTAGYRTFLGFDPAAKKGVIVLCNTNLVSDDLGLHILEPRYLAQYAGEYELAPGVAFKVFWRFQPSLTLKQLPQRARDPRRCFRAD